MSNYVKATNFTAKDALPSGNSGKIVKGAELDTEYTAIASAISSKSDINSPTFTGTPAAPTASSVTNTTQIATTAFVKAVVADLGTIGTMAAQNANSVAVTGGSITGITDLAVTDGGTGTSTLTGVVIGNGTSAMTAVAPGTSGNVLTSNGSAWASTAPTAVKGLGLGGEVWNNVTGSRSSGTTYTNSRTYPIAVSAGGSPADSGPSIQAYVGSVLVSHFNWQFNGAGARSGAFIIVPAGETYRLVFNGSGIAFWSELY